MIKQLFSQDRMFRLVFLFFLLSLGGANTLVCQVITLAQARSLPVGAAVTVRGIILNGEELGNVRFMQDGTAGIALFPGNGSQSGFAALVDRGDSILVTGTLTRFNGLLEISPVINYEILAKNQPLPPAKLLRINQFSDAFESQLVQIDCTSFIGAGPIFSGSGTYAIADADGTSSAIYLATDNPLLAQPVPNEPSDITGVLSRYGSFQLLPRGPLDLAHASCFFLSNPPQQSDITHSGFKLSWETSAPAGGKLMYGLQPDHLDQSIQNPALAVEHSTVFSNLQPGTIYWIQIQAFSDQDTVYSNVLPFCTRSTSSGQIKVFFNQGIDLAAANGLEPDGNTYEDVLQELITRINAAQVSIDAAIYNNSRSDLTFALRQANDRGVQIRYIAAESTANSALKPSPPFPVLYGNSAALMHNKFLVIDADLADQAWVMSGSMNWTNGNMIQDNNNVVFIQDQSLARTYELEFEEMWGSKESLPNLPNSRFGNQKADNTPHRFIIGDREVECYFSPSDQVTEKIVEAIESADHQASFAIFSFTKDEIGNAFIAEHNAGTWVRGLIENINDLGAEYWPLLNSGVPVQAHMNAAQLHHKYAVLDAGYPGSDPMVVTGSHNWTQTAETSNDENTLIIHDPDIATLFQAEFEQRWAEIGTASHEIDGVRLEIFPNPATDHLAVREYGSDFWSGNYEIYTVSGQLVANGFYAGAGAIISLSGLLQGSYLVSLKTEHGIAVFPVQKIRY